MSTRLATFAAVGIAGFLLDATALSALIALGAAPLAGRLVSFPLAILVTWQLNRGITFNDLDDETGTPHGPAHWRGFLAANAMGMLINLAVFAVFTATSPLVAERPVLGVAAGALASLIWQVAGSSGAMMRHIPRAENNE